MISFHAYGESCWWCGNVADSREHKYKKADLHRLFGKGPYTADAAISRVVEDQERTVQGPNSKELMFKPNLCQKCNNERSQPFDRAYDQFTNYVEANSDWIIKSKQIPFSAVFGTKWQTGRENVIRYYVKHIGCRLAEGGFLIASDVLSYLDGKGPLRCVEMDFEIREDIVAMEAKLRADNLSPGGVWIGDGMADFHKVTQSYSRFNSFVGYRWLRVNYEYDDTLGGNFNVAPSDLLSLSSGYSIDPNEFRTGDENQEVDQ